MPEPLEQQGSETPNLQAVPGPEIMPKNEISQIQGQTVTEILDVLKEARKNDQVDIDGFSIYSPKIVRKNLLQAIKLFKKALPRYIAVDLDQIFIQNLEGKIAGKATAAGVTLSAKELLHPAARIAGILLHEYLHADNKIQNEGLVQAMTEVRIGAMDTTEKYSTAVAKFEEFAEIYSKGRILSRVGNTDKATTKIYDLYYKALDDPSYFKKMHKHFMPRAKKHFKSAEQAEAFFHEVFPEIVIRNDEEMGIDNKVWGLMSAETAAENMQTPPPADEGGVYNLAA
jgi:hypothetical protein